MAENRPGYKSDERAVGLYKQGSRLNHVTNGIETHYYREPMVDPFDASHWTLKEDGLNDTDIVAYGSPKLPLTRVIYRRVKAWRVISNIWRDIYQQKGEACVFEPDWPKKRLAA